MNKYWKVWRNGSYSLKFKPMGFVCLLIIVAFVIRTLLRVHWRVQLRYYLWMRKCMLKYLTLRE